MQGNELTTSIDSAQKEFRSLCSDRLNEGEKEYGKEAFLKNDMFQYAYEELADFVNYVEMLYIKMRLLEKGIINESGDHTT